MLELLNKGGFVMYAIFLFSIAASAIALERIIYYRHTRVRNKNLFEEITGLVRKGFTDKAAAVAEKTKSALGKVTHTYLVNADKSTPVLEESVHAAATREIRKLEKHLPALSAIANLAPLLGLLGTVIGMILVFRDIESLGGQADITALAGGIWQALLTTAFGLTVAIPVAAFHHYFQNLVDERITVIETRISDLNILFERGADPGIRSAEEQNYSETGDASGLQSGDK